MPQHHKTHYPIVNSRWLKNVRIMDSKETYSPSELVRMTLQAEEAERLGFLATALAMRKVVQAMRSSRARKRKQEATKAA